MSLDKTIFKFVHKNKKLIIQMSKLFTEETLNPSTKMIIDGSSCRKSVISIQGMFNIWKKFFKCSYHYHYLSNTSYILLAEHVQGLGPTGHKCHLQYSKNLYIRTKILRTIRLKSHNSFGVKLFVLSKSHQQPIEMTPEVLTGHLLT